MRAPGVDPNKNIFYKHNLVKSSSPRQSTTKIHKQLPK
jgi:hypothetical protein